MLEIQKGDKVKFNASSRLRAIDENNVMVQTKLTEGTLIGEEIEGKVLHCIYRKDKSAFVVELSTGHYGWVYNFELYKP